MAKLRTKVWDVYEMTPTTEKKINPDKAINEHELININRDLVKVERTIVPIRKKRANETSVSARDEIVEKIQIMSSLFQCRSRPKSDRHQLPLSANLLYQVDEMVGLLTP